MKNAFIFLTFLLSVLSSVSNAGCFGSDSLYTCNDASGNRYSITKIGDITTVRGSNSLTGSTWRQTSHTIGDITYQRGTASNGNTWNQTINHIGSGITTYSGTDSSGNSFYSTCTEFGCN